MEERSKTRLDMAMVERGLASSRSQARDQIKRGCVRVEGATVTKPGYLVSSQTRIELAGQGPSYVSRGAYKLAGALDQFSFDPDQRIALDIGASTGGFTQVLLERGARYVYAVDVGHGQLHESLRLDPRVIAIDRMDARDLDRIAIPETVQALTADVSFVSLTKVLQVPMSLAGPGAWLVALIKPQFEAGPGVIGKGGIVRGEEDRMAAVETVRNWFEEQEGWAVCGTVSSPIEGKGGNQEFLLGARYM